MRGDLMNKYLIYFWDKYDKEPWHKTYSADSLEEVTIDAENDLHNGESITSIEYIGPDSE